MFEKTVRRLENNWGRSDRCWHLPEHQGANCRTVPDSSEVRFSVWVTTPSASNLVGRFALDIESAVKHGLAQWEDETGAVSFKLEHSGSDIFLGQSGGRGARAIRLPLAG
jgi:hypothetical protein